MPADDVEDAVDAEADIAASPEAIMVTPGPAGAAAEPATRPAVVRVAELTLTVELLDEAMACCAPGGAGPATTVIADAMVCIVLAEGPVLMEPTWKGWACGADMGNEPAGHMHAQLHPAFAAATPVLFPPEPATTVTAAAAAVVVEAATRASGVRVAELTEAAALDGDVVAELAVPFPAPPPATTVTAAAAPVAVVLELEEPEPDPATTVTAAAAAPLVELVELLPLPATTVTAAAVAPLAWAELAEFVALLPPPEPACTVTGLPAGVTVVEAMRASAVSLPESTGGGAADDDCAAAWTPGAGEPPALTVTGAGAAALAPLDADAPSAGFEAPSAGFEASPTDSEASLAVVVGLPPSAISVIVPGAAGAEACVLC